MQSMGPRKQLDTYNDWQEEETIPSMPVPRFVQIKQVSYVPTPIQVFAFAGLLGALFGVVGGVFDSIAWIGVGSAIAAVGNLQAMVRK